MFYIHMKIVAIKIGSSVLLNKQNKLDTFRIGHIADEILLLGEKGIGVVLVVSGAVACGAEAIQLCANDEQGKRAAAGIGQAYLMSVFQQIFSGKQLHIAQLLLTRDGLCSQRQREDLQRLLSYYLQRGIIPVINENDVIDLNSFAGNDFLGAEVAALLRVEQLLILSTMAGSTFGVGGGEAKQQAIRGLQKEGIQATIIDGKAENILSKTLL